VKWQERVGGTFFSSPVWVDGRLFGVSAKGEVVVVDNLGPVPRIGEECAG